MNGEREREERKERETYFGEHKNMGGRNGRRERESTRSGKEETFLRKKQTPVPRPTGERFKNLVASHWKKNFP